MEALKNTKGCALACNHTAGCVHVIAAGTRRVRIHAESAGCYVRSGAATLAGTHVQTATESTTATDYYLASGETAIVEVPGAHVRVAARAAADPGGTFHCIPVA